jgi:hypothetical protein
VDSSTRENVGSYQDIVAILITEIILETEDLAHLTNKMGETPFALVHPASTGRLSGDE